MPVQAGKRDHSAQKLERGKTHVKRLLAAVIAAILTAGIATGAVAAPKLRVAMVTDVGGLGDQAFNDTAYKGLKQAQKELGVDIAVVESKEVADYETNLRTLADLGYNLVFAVGFLMTDAVKAVAAAYPDTKFCIIDGEIGNLPNVVGALYKEEEAAFLAGALAAKMTKTKTIGFVLGMKVPLLEKFEAGFRAGAQTANPDVKVLVAYTGRFDDPGKGKETALTMFNSGADIVAAAAGACNLGVFEAAKAKGKGYYAMGAGSGQCHLAPGAILACQVKLINNTVVDVTRRLVNGEFSPGIVRYGLKEGGVGLCDMPYTKDKIPGAVLGTIDKLKDMIISGKIVVPTKVSELSSFKPPRI